MFLGGMYVENFKCLKEIEIEDLEDLSIFIGKNNSGKSTIFEALRSFRAMNTDFDLKTVAYDKNPKNQIRIDLVFHLRPSTRDQLLRDLLNEFEDYDLSNAADSGFFREIHFYTKSYPVSGHTGRLFLEEIWISDYDSELVRVYERTDIQNCKIADIRKSLGLVNFEEVTFNPNMTSQKYPRVLELGETFPQMSLLKSFLLEQEDNTRFFSFAPYRRSPKSLDKFGSLSLSPEGVNLPQVLDAFYLSNRDGYDEMENTIKGIVPEIKAVRAHLRGNQTSPRFTENGLRSSFYIDEMGTGVEQLLILTLATYVAKDGSIISIEEPEIHHHVQTQRNLFNFLKEQSKRKQILIVTHSSVFVDKSETTGTFLVTKHNGHSDVRKVESEDFDEIIAELGLRKSDIFLADAVLMVEGESDKRILRTFAETLSVDLDKLRIKIMPVGGRECMTYYANARVLTESKTPFKVILDSDGGNPDSIGRKLLGIDRRGKKLKDPSMRGLCKMNDIMVLPEYSIESYLMIPSAISQAFDLKREKVDKFLNDRRARRNKKQVLKDLCRYHLRRKYKEIADGGRIASYVRSSEIDSGLKQMLKRRLPRLVPK